MKKKNLSSFKLNKRIVSKFTLSNQLGGIEKSEKRSNCQFCDTGYTKNFDICPWSMYCGQDK